VFGINAGEFIVLLAVAALVLGPERLPQYAQQLARLVRELRRMAQGAQAQVREELGPEFEDVDWRKLDPRQYDPRRIVREALSDSFDPDDPLGLRDYRDLPDDMRDALADKPLSRGGPGDQPSPGNGNGLPPAARRARGDDAQVTGSARPGRPEDDVPLDPDAT
jgi:sec-independent protein translocase protein TatB